jgi:hypothetical protein
VPQELALAAQAAWLELELQHCCLQGMAWAVKELVLGLGRQRVQGREQAMKQQLSPWVAQLPWSCQPLVQLVLTWVVLQQQQAQQLLPVLQRLPLAAQVEVWMMCLLLSSLSSWPAPAPLTLT